MSCQRREAIRVFDEALRLHTAAEEAEHPRSARGPQARSARDRDGRATAPPRAAPRARAGPRALGDDPASPRREERPRGRAAPRSESGPPLGRAHIARGTRSVLPAARLAEMRDADGAVARAVELDQEDALPAPEEGAGPFRAGRGRRLRSLRRGSGRGSCLRRDRSGRPEPRPRGPARRRASRPRPSSPRPSPRRWCGGRETRSAPEFAPSFAAAFVTCSVMSWRSIFLFVPTWNSTESLILKD